MRKGFSLIELMMVIGIMAIVGFFVLPNLSGKRSATQLDLATKEIAAALREAQGRALAEASSSAWGVHLDNVVSSSPFFAVYAGTYNISSVTAREPLPSGIQFATTSVPEEGSRDISFGQATGRPQASTTVQLVLKIPAGNVTSTIISVNAFGAVSY
ncbi:MAG: prepilin-type N-terminal cleavage/methylation domain-containing protein [Candidatus Liptonbacteria bacterium]